MILDNSFLALRGNWWAVPTLQLTFDSQEVDIIHPSFEQILQIRALSSRFENFQCVECARSIRDYLIARSIRGKHIKLYTGSVSAPNNYIYDDSVPGDAISENGRHEGIAILINDVEMVFDNHHPDGVPRDEWMANLQFHGKILSGQQFQVTEEEV